MNASSIINLKAAAFQALTQEKSIQNLVTALSEIIGNPIGIGLSLNNATYLSPNMMKEREGPLTYISMKSDIQALISNHKNNQPFYLDSSNDDYGRIISVLQLNGDIAGYFEIVFCNFAYSSRDMEVASVVKEVFELALVTDLGGAFILETDNNTKVLQGLLKGEKNPFSESALWGNFELNRKFPLQLLVVMRKDQTFSDPGQKIVEQLSAAINSDHYCFDDLKLVFLCNGHVNEREDLIEASLQKFDLVAGVSHPFYKLKEMKERYHQALDAIRLGLLNKPKQLHYFDEYILLLLLDENAIEKKWEGICHPIALALHNYDQKSDTSLLETVGIYISTGRNLNATAKQLNVHRNTVMQRLNKVCELTDACMSFTTTLMDTYLSTMIIRQFENTES
ncbi:MAG: PucR family transcriptional regulator [Anaerovoracaceae bacterium]|jgi:hypothetical protein